MSSRRMEEVRCACGERFEAELWTSLNVAEEPDLREALGAGEINVVRCPACGQVFYVECFLLYHDPHAELLAFVHPADQVSRSAELAARMEADFGQALEGLEGAERLAYRPVLMFGLDALVELVHREDEVADEVAILEHMAREFGLALARLPAAVARACDLPRLLPVLPVTGGPREQVLAGLRLLLQRNGHLSHYRALLERISADASWTLPAGVRIPSPPL